MSKPDDLEALKAEIARLNEALGLANQRAEDAEKNARMAAFTAPMAEEYPISRTVKIKKCVNPWVKTEKEQKWEEVEVPLYAYRIELPASAGLSSRGTPVDIVTNGISYFHGEVYEVDMDTLRDLKSRVARTWDHERQIHGDNENKWRKPVNSHLKSREYAQKYG